MITAISPVATSSDHKSTADRNAIISRDAILVVLWLSLSLAVWSNFFGASRDYYQYLSYFETIPNTLSLLDTRFEPGFHLFAWIFLNWFQSDINTFLLVLSATSLAIKFMLFRKYLHYPILSACLYSIIFFPIHEYTQYRAGISLALAYWAVHKILEKSFVSAFIIFAIAFSFHYSSIILLFVTVGAIFVRGRKAFIGLIVTTIFGIIFIQQIRFLFQDTFNALNPLSEAYLINSAMIDRVNITSVNNTILMGVILCYITSGKLQKSVYHSVFMTIVAGSVLPIILLPDAPVIAQRSKEVLFVGLIFLVCRSRITAFDFPGFMLTLILTGVLGYLWVDGGVISFPLF